MGAYTLQGQRALITGGGRGIGRYIALGLAQEGCKVAVAARTELEVQSVAAEVTETGGEALAITADIADEQSVADMVAKVEQEWGGIDILVNNAAIFKGRGHVVNLSLEDWNRMLSVNLTGYFLTTKAVLPGMIERESGSVIMMSSTAGKRGDPSASAYCASKFGVNGLAHSLLHEVRRKNIRVQVISPSLVDTSTNPDIAVETGRGAHMHAKDVAEATIATLKLPPRTLVRDIELWGNNP